MALHRSLDYSRSRPLPQLASRSAGVGRVKPAEVLQPITLAPRKVRRCIESASTGKWWAKSPRPEADRSAKHSGASGSGLDREWLCIGADLLAVETAPTSRFTRCRRRAGETRRGAAATTSAPRMVRRCIESASTGKWWAKSSRPEADRSAKHSGWQVGAVLTANGSASEPDLFAVETAPTSRFTQRWRRAGETRRGASANHLGAAHGAVMR